MMADIKKGGLDSLISGNSHSGPQTSESSEKYTKTVSFENQLDSFAKVIVPLVIFGVLFGFSLEKTVRYSGAIANIITTKNDTRKKK